MYATASAISPRHPPPGFTIDFSSRYLSYPYTIVSALPHERSRWSAARYHILPHVRAPSRALAFRVLLNRNLQNIHGRYSSSIQILAPTHSCVYTRARAHALHTYNHARASISTLAQRHRVTVHVCAFIYIYVCLCVFRLVLTHAWKDPNVYKRIYTYTRAYMYTTALTRYPRVSRSAPS